MNKYPTVDIKPVKQSKEDRPKVRVIVGEGDTSQEFEFVAMLKKVDTKQDVIDFASYVAGVTERAVYEYYERIYL